MNTLSNPFLKNENGNPSLRQNIFQKGKINDIPMTNAPL